MKKFNRYGKKVLSVFLSMLMLMSAMVFTSSAADDSSVCESGHSFLAWVVTLNPTCAEDGIESRTCKKCGTTETREVAALGHDLKHHDAKEATCSEIGWEAYDTCSRCDYSTYSEIPAAHDFTGAEWEVVTESTCSKDGECKRTCVNCNGEIEGGVETQAIEAESCLCHSNTMYGQILVLVYTVFSIITGVKLTCCDDMYYNLVSRDFLVAQ